MSLALRERRASSIVVNRRQSSSFSIVVVNHRRHRLRRNSRHSLVGLYPHALHERVQEAGVEERRRRLVVLHDGGRDHERGSGAHARRNVLQQRHNVARRNFRPARSGVASLTRRRAVAQSRRPHAQVLRLIKVFGVVLQLFEHDRQRAASTGVVAVDVVQLLRQALRHALRARGERDKRIRKPLAMRNDNNDHDAEPNTKNKRCATTRCE